MKGGITIHVGKAHAITVTPSLLSHAPEHLSISYSLLTDTFVLADFR